MKIPYQLVSMAVILRDYVDEEVLKYQNKEHELLTDIADGIYNVYTDPESMKDEYRDLYHKYGEDYFNLVIDDAHAIDSQCTSDDKVYELAEDYFDRLGENINASTKVTATEDNSYAHNLVKISRKDAKYALANLNKSKKTLGLYGVPGDKGYYVSEFEEATPGFMWASDSGLQILDDADIPYTRIEQYKVESSKKIKASDNLSSYSEDYYDFDDFVMDLGDRLAERKISRADADREIKKFCRDHRTCDYRTLHNIVYENAAGKVDAENDRLRKQIKDRAVKASDNPFYDKLSAKDKRFANQVKEDVGVITLKGKVGKYDTYLTIDMWYGDKFEPMKYGADASFYGNDGEYRGNIYNDAGEIIGDYTSDDSTLISKNFQIDWGD